jgi:hypothetical protein
LGIVVKISAKIQFLRNCHRLQAVKYFWKENLQNSYKPPKLGNLLANTSYPDKNDFQNLQGSIGF